MRYLLSRKGKGGAAHRKSSYIKAFCSPYQSKITTVDQRHLTAGRHHDGACSPHSTTEQYPTGWESILPTVHLSDWKSSSKSLCQAASKYTNYEQQWLTDEASAALGVPVRRIICQLSPSTLKLPEEGARLRSSIFS